MDRFRLVLLKIFCFTYSTLKNCHPVENVQELSRVDTKDSFIEINGITYHDLMNIMVVEMFVTKLK